MGSPIGWIVSLKVSEHLLEFDCDTFERAAIALA